MVVFDFLAGEALRSAFRGLKERVAEVLLGRAQMGQQERQLVEGLGGRFFQQPQVAGDD